jgi:TRAP-type C4-dicarboxylate transport system permease small subunit
VHPLKHPRNVVIVGLIFVVISVVYYVGADLWGGYVHIDFAGVTMLAALGVAMSLMAYVLVAGSTRD